MSTRRRSHPVPPAPATPEPPADDVAGDVVLGELEATVDEPRRGVKTSEFALSCLVTAAAVVLCLAGKIDGQAAMGYATGAAGVYTLSRGIAKLRT